MSLRPPTPQSTSLSTSTLSWITGPSAPSRILQGPSGGSLWSGRIFHWGLSLLFITHDPAVRGSEGSLRLRWGKGGGAALGDSVSTGAPQSPHPQPSVGHPDPDCPQPGHHPRPHIPAWLPDPPPPNSPARYSLGGTREPQGAGPGGTIATTSPESQQIAWCAQTCHFPCSPGPRQLYGEKSALFSFFSQRKK